MSKKKPTPVSPEYDAWLANYRAEKKKREEELKEKKEALKNGGKEEVLKDRTLKCVRRALAELNVRYTEEVAESGSVYFHLEVDSDWADPCIRVSDHFKKKKLIFLAEFVYTETSHRKSKQKLYENILRIIKAGLRRRNLAERHKAFERLDDEKV